jgi:hypothetical protein
LCEMVQCAHHIYCTSSFVSSILHLQHSPCKLLREFIK